MAFWHIANSYGNYLTVFLILENLLMFGLIIVSIKHYFTIRKIERCLHD